MQQPFDWSDQNLILAARVPADHLADRSRSQIKIFGVEPCGPARLRDYLPIVAVVEPGELYEASRKLTSTSSMWNCSRLSCGRAEWRIKNRYTCLQLTFVA